MGRQAPSSGFPCKVLQGFFLVLLDLSLRAGVSGTLRRGSFTGVAHARSITMGMSSNGFPSASTGTLVASSSCFSVSSTSGTHSSSSPTSCVIAACSGVGALTGARSGSSLCAPASVPSGSSGSSSSSSPVALGSRSLAYLRCLGSRRVCSFLLPRLLWVVAGVFFENSVVTGDHLRVRQFAVPRDRSHRRVHLGVSQRQCHPVVRVERILHWGLFSSFLQLAADPETEAIGEFYLRVVDDVVVRCVSEALT